MSERRENQIAAERLDILEDLLPRASCQKRGCDAQARYQWEGDFGKVFWLCSRHRALYRTHDRILAQIRSL